jgi:hypothetical protein
MPADWPTDADLAAELGLAAGDDAGRVTTANAAAISGAKYLLSIAQDDATPPSLDDEQFKCVLGVGVWWYEFRNRPEGLDSLNPVANPYSRRVVRDIMLRGKLAIG